jgi:hypothetical protein
MENKAWPYMAGTMDSEGSIGMSISIRELNSDPVRDSATTDTLNVSKKLEIKTQSELIGDDKSALVET